MVTLRLTRTGRKHYATYRVVAIDKRAARDSRAIEYLGNYNPHTKEITLEKERIEYWLSTGAQPSDTVKRLLAREGIIEAPTKKDFKKKPGRKAQERAEKAAAEAETKKTEASKPAEEEKPAEPETPAEEAKE